MLDVINLSFITPEKNQEQTINLIPEIITFSPYLINN